MRSWAILLAGLLIWAVHFFLAYGIAEFAGSGPGARTAVNLLTLMALAAVLAIAWRIGRGAPHKGPGHLGRQVGLAGLLVGGVAILWQGLPAVLM